MHCYCLNSTCYHENCPLLWFNIFLGSLLFVAIISIIKACYIIRNRCQISRGPQSTEKFEVDYDTKYAEKFIDIHEDDILPSYAEVVP